MSKNNETVSDKISRLNQEIEWFYGDDFQLSEAVEKYQSANKLAGEITKELDELKNQVEVIENFTKN